MIQAGDEAGIDGNIVGEVLGEEEGEVGADWSTAVDAPEKAWCPHLGYISFPNFDGPSALAVVVVVVGVVDRSDDGTGLLFPEESVRQAARTSTSLQRNRQAS